MHSTVQVSETSTRHWVIGDVHGCLLALDELLELLPPGDHLIFCGDVVGRGPDIQTTAERVWGLVSSGRATWLRGNHEQRLINAQAARLEGEDDTPCKTNPCNTKQWIARLRTLPVVFQGDGWVATHAGFDQDGHPDLEIREPFWRTYDGRFGRVVVAHTPGDDVRYQGQIVIIDTGAVYGGQLTAFCPETEAVVQVNGLSNLTGSTAADATQTEAEQIKPVLVSSGPC